MRTCHPMRKHFRGSFKKGRCMHHEQRLAFVRSHRTTIFGVNRKNDGPSMSVVYDVMDGNDILII